MLKVKTRGADLDGVDPDPEPCPTSEKKTGSGSDFREIDQDSDPDSTFEKETRIRTRIRPSRKRLGFGPRSDLRERNQDSDPDPTFEKNWILILPLLSKIFYHLLLSSFNIQVNIMNNLILLVNKYCKGNKC